MLNFQKEISHTPVLVSEILSLFCDKYPPEHILDCTFGRGGHSLAFLKEYPQVFITALDRDSQAIEHGSSLKESQAGRIHLLKKNFHEFAKAGLQKPAYEMILMDLGVSSPQLDEGERGFSFSKNGPLDMRMDPEQELTAAHIVNTWSKKELIELFRSYGELRNPYSVVEAIFNQRRKKKFTTTWELAHLIQKTISYRSFGKHPATVWFLALRMKVNEELDGLQNCLPDYLPLLKEKGYFVVISFHSLEDRIVKHSFRQFVQEGKGELWNKKVLRPNFEEKKQNPRSRSAKMRVFIKRDLI